MRKSTRFKVRFAGAVLVGMVCLAAAGIGAIAFAALFVYEFCKLAFA